MENKQSVFNNTRKTILGLFIDHGLSDSDKE